MGDHLDVNEFTVQSFDAVYSLDRRANGRQDLQVVETIVVDYPRPELNHGIERSLPTSYRGRPLSPTLGSVTDADGTAYQVATSTQDGQRTWRIGNPATYASGRTTYVIGYTVINAVQDFGDHQELYWDVNGDQWLQPIGRTSMRLTVAPTIGTAGLTGAMTCYLPYGRRCPISADGAVVTAQTGALDPYQTMTIAVGFAPGTVTDPGGRGLAGVDLAPYVLGAGGGVLALTLLWLVVAGLRARRTDAPLVAESTPPDDLSPAFAACLLGRPERAISAELLHQAVHGTIRLSGEGRRIGAQRIDRLTLPSGGDRGRLVNRALQSVFDVPNLNVGEQVADVAASVRRTRSRPLAKEYARFCAANAEGLWRRRSWLVGRLHLVMFAGAFVAAVLLAPLTSIPVVLISVGALLVAAAIVRGLVAAPRLSPVGQETVRHLLGLQMFIRTADTHRLEIMQGAQTAERGLDDDGVVLYEKLIGWAVALGVEDSWRRVIGGLLVADAQHHDGARPMRWFVGDQDLLFGRGRATSALSPGVGWQLAGQQTAASVVPGGGTSSRSSGSTGGGWSSGSSGGSSGGGFSGGGGGGGGGGGW